ncbi:GAF and ANTAR domain-containing protein [Jiangella endophytica]|uniref:GAF and ANTAR domain-containing protein n=1 Tax=Jiangella endophytica TaxID=1623398 RepID=UPI000E354722|nr:GAF and ANTAR domain-containing protein [Jiangella endophytica]
MTADQTISTGSTTACALLSSSATLHDFLTGLAGAVARDLGGGVSCSLTVRRGPRVPVTSGSSDAVAAALEETQYITQDGPSLRAVQAGEPVRVDYLAADVRWPELTLRGTADGVAAVLAVPVDGDLAPVGALTVYARRADALDAAMRARVAELAAQQAVALHLALRMFEYAAHAEHLRVALTSRYVIDQALGVLMSRHSCNARTAFEILRRRSQRDNVKLRKIAAEIIVSTTGEPPVPPGPDR